MRLLTRVALAHPRATIAIATAIVALAAMGLPRMKTEIGYRGVLGDEHPSVQRLEAFLDEFGGGLPVLAVWSCAETSLCDSVFDPRALWMAKAVGDAISAHPLVRQVDSPATSPVLVAGPSGFDVRRFIEGGEVVPDRQWLSERALQDSLWEGNLVSADGMVGAIAIQLASSDSRTTSTVVPALREILAPYEEEGFRFYLVGDPVDFAVAGEGLRSETPRIVPLMVILILAIVFALFRSWRAALLALGTTGLAVVCAMGTMAWLGWPQSELTQALAPAILVIGVCAAIHVLSRYASGTWSDSEPLTLAVRKLRMIDVAGEVGPACFMAALTTAAGFLSFSTSGFASFLRFGVVAAIGVMAALVLTFTLMPVFLVRIPQPGKQAARASDAWDRTLRLIVGVAERRTWFVLLFAGALVLIGGFGLSRLQIDVDEKELLGANSDVIRWAAFVEENLRRTDTLEIELVVPQGESALDPEGLRSLSEIAAFLPSIEGLGRVRSLLDPLRRLNQLVHDDDPDYYAPAASRAANVQLLWVMGLDAGTRPGRWINAEHRRVRLSIEADPAPKTRRVEILEEVTAHLEATLPAGWEFRYTGPFSLYLDLVREMQRTQLRSFATAALVVTLLFWGFLWATGSSGLASFRWAMIGMIPNGLPVLVTLGAMGLWGINLDVATIMVGAIVLGIAVDDTIHLITQYRTERNRGADSREAIATAVRRVGRAVISTSLALSLGFFALMISSWQSVASFGLLSGIAILAALIADLFVLPALILGVQPLRLPPETPRASRPLGAQGRVLVALLAGVGVGAALFMTASQTADATRSVSFGCRLLPGGHVSMLASLSTSCPLHRFDRVDAVKAGTTSIRLLPGDDESDLLPFLDPTDDEVQLRLTRSGRSLSARVPLVSHSPWEEAVRLSAMALLPLWMLGCSLFLVFYSTAPASVPFLAVYSCLAVLSLNVLDVGGGPPWVYLAALGVLPAATAHFALGFPHRSALQIAAPRIVHGLYAAGILNAGILIWGVHQYPALWRMASSVSTSLTALIWLGLLAKCVFAREESAHGLERVRARVAVRGTLVTLTAGAALALAIRATDTLGPLALVLSAAVALPLPFGYSLARYQLNDIRPHVRQAVSYAFVHILGAGILATLIFSAFEWSADQFHPGPAMGLLGLSLVLLLGGMARDGLWNGLRRWLPTVDTRLRRLESGHAQRLEGLSDTNEISSVTAETLQRAVSASGVAVFLPTSGGWTLAGRRGERGPVELRLAELAIRLLAERTDAMNLALEVGAEGPHADDLRASGIELAAPLRVRSKLVGLVLIAQSRSELPFSTREVRFVSAICSRAAIAIHGSHLAEELLQAERMATIGQIATGLAHDLGKPISVVYQRARAMSRDRSNSKEVRHHLSGIASLADEALTTLDHLLDRGGARREATIRFQVDEVLTLAIQAVERIHGSGRVLLRLTPDLPAIFAAREVRQVLVNLLDNALRAGPTEPVEVYAFREAAGIRIDVTDRGCGMDPGTLEQAFSPFFSTRAGEGGWGIGLAASRAIIEGLGGTIAIESNVGVGTLVRLAIPGASEELDEA